MLVKVYAYVFTKSATWLETTNKYLCVIEVNRHTSVCQGIHALVFKAEERKE